MYLLETWLLWGGQICVLCCPSLNGCWFPRNFYFIVICKLQTWCESINSTEGALYSRSCLHELFLRCKLLYPQIYCTQIILWCYILSSHFLQIICFPQISNMVEKVPSFKSGGAYWFIDLTTTDSLYIFPILTALTFLITVEVDGPPSILLGGNKLMIGYISFGFGICYSFCLDLHGLYLCNFVVESTNLGPFLSATCKKEWKEITALAPWKMFQGGLL